MRFRLRVDALCVGEGEQDVFDGAEPLFDDVESLGDRAFPRRADGVAEEFDVPERGVQLVAYGRQLPVVFGEGAGGAEGCRPPGPAAVCRTPLGSSA